MKRALRPAFVVSLAVLHMLVFATDAFAAVTAAPPTPKAIVSSESLPNSVAPSLAMRANSEIQIRRLRGMLVDGRVANEEQAIDQLDRLQRQLRGRAFDSGR